MSVAAVPYDVDDILGELNVEFALLNGAFSVTTKQAKNSIISGWETVEKDLFLSPVIAQLDGLLGAVKRLRDLETDWDSYGAPAPSTASLRLADAALRRAFATKNLPDSVVPSADGGLALCWDRGDKHAYLEFDNNGGAIAASYLGMRDPRIVEIPGNDSAAIDGQIAAIGRFLS